MNLSSPAMNSGYAIQCSSMRRIQLTRNALFLCRRRALMYTTRAPSSRAARSCAVRPALSKITTSGRQLFMISMTVAE